MVYLLVANFMSHDYLPHLCSRLIFVFSTGTMHIFERNRNEENSIFTGSASMIILVLLVEMIIYVNHKAKANLFMRIKVI